MPLEAIVAAAFSIAGLAASTIIFTGNRWRGRLNPSELAICFALTLGISAMSFRLGASPTSTLWITGTTLWIGALTLYLRGGQAPEAA